MDAKTFKNLSKRIGCFIFAVIFPISASAAPFLVCDPQAGVDYYKIYQDNVLLVDNHLAEADGSLRYDLQDITPGSYAWHVEACNDWGCKRTVDPYISDGAITAPQNLRLEP